MTALASKLMHVRFQCLRLGVADDPQADLPAIASHAAQHGWSLSRVPRPRRLFARQRGGS